MNVSEPSARYPARTTLRRVHVALAALGAGGIILSFFSFAFDYVPIRDFYPGGFLAPSWWSVLPCMLLPVPIALGYGAWFMRGILPRWYSMSAYGVAGISAGLFLSGLILDYAFDGIAGIINPALFLAAFGAVAGLIVLGIDHDPRAGLIAMQAVYIVQMQFWLVLAAGDFQAGALLGIATSLAYLAQVTLVTERRAWLILLLVPAAALTITLATEA